LQRFGHISKVGTRVSPNWKQANGMIDDLTWCMVALKAAANIDANESLNDSASEINFIGAPTRGEWLVSFDQL
jgi:hypothetical protein